MSMFIDSHGKEKLKQKKEEPIEQVLPAVKTEYFPDGTCWLCHRKTGTGNKVRIVSDNGFFALHMCAECQTRFRVG